METELLIHLCGLQSEMYGLPFSLLDGENLLYCSHYCGDMPLSSLIAEDADESICGFFVDSHMFAVGHVRDEESGKMILVGPIALGGAFTENSAAELLQRKHQNCTREDIQTLAECIKPLRPMEISSVKRLLCLLHGSINRKVITFEEVSGIERLREKLVQERAAVPRIQDILDGSNNSSLKLLTQYIRTGQTEKAEQLLVSKEWQPYGRLGGDTLRHSKNSTIILVSMAAHAAIDGGVDESSALLFQELYVVRAEKCSDLRELGAVSLSMIKSFCELVANNKSLHIEKPIVRKAAAYISNNCSKAISLENVAAELKVSKQYLSRLFSEETGVTITDYIRKEKIDYAKKLLVATDYSLAEIAAGLSFSSQSYFQKMFKDFEGCTPQEYRNGF